MKRAIYTSSNTFISTLFPSWEPGPVEVEFISWEPNGMARIRAPFAENSIGAMIARKAGKLLPPPMERLVPAANVRLIDEEP